MRFLTDFIEHRLGLRSAWRAAMVDKRPPQGIGWLRTLGFCALTVLLLQFLSGLALAMHYVPSTDLAYDSIRAFEQDVPYGAQVRALHHFGASAFVIFAVLHLLRVFFTGAYKRPRELTWLTGLGLLLVVLGFGFTGYLLPWDQKAYFATKVGVEIAGKTPGIGEHVREILAGGDTVGAPTLTRFYVIHVVLLPLALLGLLAVHLLLIQRHGVAAPGRPVGDEGEPGPPYFPGHVFKEVVAALLVTAVLFWISWTWRAPLEALAEPSDQSYDPRPDWYFLGLFQLLKLFKGPMEPIGAFWLPNAVLVALALLPFVDRTRHRSWRRRPLMIGLGTLVLVGIVAVTVMGALDRADNAPTLRHALGLTNVERNGYLMLRRLRCMDCHAHEREDGTVLGGSEEHEDAPLLDELDHDPETMVAILRDPQEMLSEETAMPSFDHVPYEQLHALALYLRTVVE